MLTIINDKLRTVKSEFSFEIGVINLFNFIVDLADQIGSSKCPEKSVISYWVLWGKSIAKSVNFLYYKGKLFKKKLKFDQ